MNFSIDDINEGDAVTVSTWVGGTRSGIIQGVHANIKNGRPGIDYTDDDGSWWAYLDQVMSISTP